MEDSSSLTVELSVTAEDGCSTWSALWSADDAGPLPEVGVEVLELAAPAELLGVGEGAATVDDESFTCWPADDGVDDTESGAWLT